MAKHLVLALVTCLAAVSLAHAETKTNRASGPVVVADVAAKKTANRSASTAKPSAARAADPVYDNYQLERDSCCVGSN